MFSAVVRQPSRWNIRAPSSPEDKQLVFRIIAAAHNLRSQNDSSFEYLRRSESRKSEFAAQVRVGTSDERRARLLHSTYSSLRKNRRRCCCRRKRKSRAMLRSVTTGRICRGTAITRRARHPFPLKLS